MDWFSRLNQRAADKASLPDELQCLPGRSEPILTSARHAVFGNSLHPPFPANMETVAFGLGCFWGAERLFWSLDGVYVTAVGYCGGYTPNPTYDEVCSGKTAHTEVVLVVYDPDKVGFSELLKSFWVSHDPTQGMRQGNDVGTQYRSAIYVSNNLQHEQALESKEHYALLLNRACKGEVTTEIDVGRMFYYAESYHQQYLAKNPEGYCGLRGTGVSYE